MIELLRKMKRLILSKKDTRKGTQYLFFWPTGETLLRHSWNIDRDKSVISYSTKGPMTKLEK